MVHTKLTNKAINLAYRAHLNQQDEDKLPKIYKAISLGNKMDNEFDFCVAILYQAVLDKKISLNNLKKDFPFQVTDAIFILIPDDSLAYPDYVRRIKTNNTSTKVKIAELEYDLLKEENNKNKHQRNQNIQRYNFALNILKK